MLKSFSLILGLVLGTNPNVVTVAPDTPAIVTTTVVTPPPVNPAVTAPVTPEFGLVGPSEVITGDFLSLQVVGVESKMVDGVRVPKVRVGIDPPTKNLIREDNGYRLYLTEPLRPGEKEKVFTITVSVNNPDPNEPPLMAMKRYKIIADSTITVVIPTKPGEPVVNPPVDPSTKVTSLVYVYEKDKNPLTSQIRAGMNEVNLGGKVTASYAEVDDIDGTGEVPEQHKLPLEVGRAQGLPVLVKMSENAVVGFVKEPTTKEQILEAAK